MANDMRPIRNEFVVPPTESFNNETMQGSMQQILAANIGTIVNCDLLIGTGNLIRKEGILYSVGRSYFTLMDTPSGGRYTVCDIFSLKFITFIHPGQIQEFAGYRAPELAGEGQSGMSGLSTNQYGTTQQPQSFGQQNSGGFGRLR